VVAARVHDLGKIASDNRILLKRTTVDRRRAPVIATHPVDGADLADKFSMFRKGKHVHRHHSRAMGWRRVPRWSEEAEPSR